MTPSSPDSNDPKTLGTAHARLDPLLGHWTGEGTLGEAADDGAGNPITLDERYTRLPGGFFVEHRGTMGFGGDTPALESVQLIGVDEGAGTFPSHQFDSLGFHREYEGRVDGDTWTFAGPWERATITLGDGGRSMHVRWERNADGSGWKSLCEYRATKQGG